MPDWILQMGGYLLAAGALYGAIRADLQHAKVAAEAAHRRIDDHLRDHLSGNLNCTHKRGA